MKTYIAILITILGINATVGADASGLFNAKESNLSVFGSWVDKSGSDVAPGVGFSYFLTRYIGIGASTHWENYGGSFIDNMAGEVYFRLPLNNVPLAPYGLVGLGYSFETEEMFEHVGGGAEWRFSNKWGVFSDARWQFNNDSDSGIGVRFGLRFVF